MNRYPHIVDFLRREDGAMAIEFAIVGVILVMLLICGFDIGMAFYSYMQVQASAEAGAQYAAVHGYNTSAINTAAISATSTSGISATSSEFCGCASSTGVSSAVCATTCSDGSAAGVYVSVTANRVYSTLLSYPIISSTYRQASTSTVRIQ